MNRGWIGLGVVIVAALLLCGLPVAVVLNNPAPASACAATGPLRSAIGAVEAVGRWDAEQVGNAAQIVAVGRANGVPARGWVIAVATAMVESSLHNLNGGDRDSLGLFQQRPSQGWGTPAQIIDPVYAATKFYSKLQRIGRWESLPLTVAAQRVQVSAFPDRYGTYEHAAEQVVAAVVGVTTIADLPGASLADCSSDPVTVAASGWTVPLGAPVGSRYGPRDGKFHAGVDLGAARNTVIHAASAGRVVWAGCDLSTGNCDVDGSPAAKGCGWYVDLVHADGYGTRYCHMVRRPDVSEGDTVQAGQRLGLVGTSGHSSGPHLHFQTHQRVCAGSRCDLDTSNSTNPVEFMRQRGAPLGEERG
ncbi:M23 family metallopeptidase [Micromonospora sp. STR1_7]|uniref:M23 family metallopeptidase n=1 Tax=Micromonospora parastrephiae TaxID=2806101 RepID=A0ABS1XMP9_9ACTN|nr:M23 family metallopeptidase [Micromonospora parastrephiae]MBM0230536.1 M23 family metallopeptidase [Micromonospora parastrephiae]